MIKNHLNRERLEKIKSWRETYGAGSNVILSAEEAEELARIALAAMDSESWCLPLDYLQGHKDGLEWASQLAEANHPETGDWLYDDPIELAKAIRKGPDMPPAQPVADSEPVAWLWSRDGDDERDVSLTPPDGDDDAADAIECGWTATPLYRHAQQQVVPPMQHWEELCREYPDMSIGDAIIRAAWWNHCRAAMLQAEPVTTANKLGNSPVIPEGYVMVPKEPTAQMYDAGDRQMTTKQVWDAMLAAAPQEVNHG